MFRFLVFYSFRPIWNCSRRVSASQTFPTNITDSYSIDSKLKKCKFVDLWEGFMMGLGGLRPTKLCIYGGPEFIFLGLFRSQFQWWNSLSSMCQFKNSKNNTYRFSVDIHLGVGPLKLLWFVNGWSFCFNVALIWLIYHPPFIWYQLQAIWKTYSTVARS